MNKYKCTCIHNSQEPLVIGIFRPVWGRGPPWGDTVIPTPFDDDDVYLNMLHHGLFKTYLQYGPAINKHTCITIFMHVCVYNPYPLKLASY
jgi:hypothetical protein